MQTPKRSNSPFIRGWTVAGIILLIPMLLLVVRFVLEETWLTLGDGPQMVGYSFAHGSYALLILAPFLLMAWLLVSCAAIVIALVQGKQSWKSCFQQRRALSFCWLSSAFRHPSGNGCSFRTFARIPHAPDLITSVAAEGYTRTVRGYLTIKVHLPRS